MTKKMTSIKLLSLLITLFFAVGFGYGQTTLAAGDIAITGFNSGAPSQLTFVLLRDITNNTQINFTDNGWNSSSGLRTTEGTLTWQANSDLPCGTEIFLERVTNSNLTASQGTIIGAGSFALNKISDQILAYQGSRFFPNFIYSIHYGSTSWSNGVDANSTAIPSGLTDGINAVYFENNPNGKYLCSDTSNQSLILAAVSTATNWNIRDTRFATLGGCTYTCVPCPTTTTWTAGAWDKGMPTINTNVIIADNYDIGNGGSEISFSSCSLTVNAGFTLTVTNGDYVEVENDVTVNGQLIVQTQANFVQNNDAASFTDNTSNGVVLTKDKFSEAWYSYTYWSSPVVNETVENALGITPADRRFKFEAANFVDMFAEIGNTNTFTSGSDGFDDDGNDWQPATGLMIPGVGYAATAGEFAPFFPITEQFPFFGEFNNGEVLVSLVNNSGGAYDDWNFIGNPYPGAISADTFFTVNNGLVGSIYLWDQATPPSSSNGGSQASNFSSDDYAVINGTGTVAGARGETGLPPNRYVASCQGFFVEALAAGNVTFNNSMRSITADNSQFFKNSNSKNKTTATQINKLWLNLTSDNGVFNQSMIGYINGATNGNDGSFYDAPKNTTSAAAAILYTTIEGSNKVFAIQGKDPNSLNESEVINLGFNTFIDVPTIYTLSIPKLQGDFLSSHTVYLRDNLTSTIHDLTTSDYTFTSDVGAFTNRFEIVFTPQALSTRLIEADTNALQILQVDDAHVRFTVTHNTRIKSVRIFDVLGRQLYQLKGHQSTETYNLSNLNNAVYIAKVELSNGALITKKAIKK